MSNYFKLIVEYDGTRFNGFQRQTSTASPGTSEDGDRPPKRPRWDANGKRKGVAFTVQAVLEYAFWDWSRQSIAGLNLRFAGRTDKGVHARGQVVAVRLPESLIDSNVTHEWEWRRALNSRLPEDISVLSMERCESNFEPRHDAKLKTYTYTVKYRRKVYQTHPKESNDKVLLPICQSGGVHSFRSAHDGNCIWLCPWALDDSLLHQVCERLKGKHNYSAFVHKVVRDRRDNTMEVTRLEAQQLSQSDEEAPIVKVQFVVESTGFRRSMVRNLIGFVVDVCRGEVPFSDVDKVWDATKEAAAMVHAAPASGLCLEKVGY